LNKFRYILLFQLLSILFYGQNKKDTIDSKYIWITYINYSESDAIKKFATTLNEENPPTYYTKKNGDTLIFVSTGEPELTKLFMKDGFCQYSEFVFSCGSCTPHYIADILKDKKYGWLKVSDTKYVGTKYRFELNLKKDINNNCNTIWFTYSNMSKKQKKELKKQKQP